MIEKIPLKEKKYKFLNQMFMRKIFFVTLINTIFSTSLNTDTCRIVGFVECKNGISMLESNHVLFLFIRKVEL